MVSVVFPISIPDDVSTSAAETQRYLSCPNQQSRGKFGFSFLCYVGIVIRVMWTYRKENTKYQYFQLTDSAA